MPGGGVVLLAPTDVDRIEAPVTFKAYLMYVQYQERCLLWKDSVELTLN